jgi:hypothetical protein
MLSRAKRPLSTGVPKADPTLFLRVYFRYPGKHSNRDETALKADPAGIGIAMIGMGKVTNKRGPKAYICQNSRDPVS